MTTQSLRFIVSAGHAEYGDRSSPVVEEIWNPTGDGTWDSIYAARHGDIRANYGSTDRLAAALFTERTGVPADELPAIDFTWEVVWRITGLRPQVAEWLDLLIVDLAAGPSGDDDTYDYWPSGVRLAHQVALFLDDDEIIARVRATALEIMKALGLSADEVGLGLTEFIPPVASTERS